MLIGESVWMVVFKLLCTHNMPVIYKLMSLYNRKNGQPSPLAKYTCFLRASVTQKLLFREWFDLDFMTLFFLLYWSTFYAKQCRWSFVWDTVPQLNMKYGPRCLNMHDDTINCFFSPDSWASMRSYTISVRSPTNDKMTKWTLTASSRHGKSQPHSRQTCPWRTTYSNTNYQVRLTHGRKTHSQNVPARVVKLWY